MVDVLEIIHNLYDTESSRKRFKWDDASFRTGNGGHSLKLYAQRSNTNITKQMFLSHRQSLGIPSLNQSYRQNP